jgi:hypothetical protein
MRKLKRSIIAVVAAATVATASLAATPPASAMPMSCVTRIALALTYIGTGDAFYAVGNYGAASYWYGKAEGIVSGCS